MYSGVMVGGIAVCVVLGTFALLELAPDIPLLILAFAGTLLVYQAERFVYRAAEDEINQPKRIAWAKENRVYVRGSLLAALVGALLVLPRLRPEVLVVGAGLAVLSTVYMLPVLPGKKRLKGAGYLKPGAIALGWSVGGVVLPVLEVQQALSLTVVLLGGYRFFLVFANALVSDWPDRKGDEAVGLVTPAGRNEEGVLRRFALLAVLVSMGLGVILLWKGTVPRMLLLVDGVGLVLLATWIAGPWYKRWYFGLILDVLVAWPVVTFLVH